jgi:hypothetical protein
MVGVHTRAQESRPSAEALVRGVMESLRGKESAVHLWSMEVRRPGRGLRREFISYVYGTSKSFYHFLEPAGDRDTTLLVAGGAVQMYSPKARKTVTIPKGLMSSGVFGSDLQYHDLVCLWRLDKDFEPKILGLSRAMSRKHGKVYVVDLRPKEKVPVPYGKVRMWIRYKGKVLLRLQIYDADLKVTRVLSFSGIKKVEGRFLGAIWDIFDLGTRGHSTRLVLLNTAFDMLKDGSLFKEASLRSPPEPFLARRPSGPSFHEKLLATIPDDMTLIDCTVGPHGHTVAYRAKKGGKWYIVCGDKTGEGFDAIGCPFFSPDGKTVAYEATGEGRKRFMVVGDRKGPGFDSVASGVFSPDGKTLAYSAEENGKSFIVVGGKKGEEFDDVGGPVFSPDGRAVAYAAREGDRWFIVVGDKKAEAGDRVFGFPVFSRDGKKVALCAQKGRELWRKVMDLERASVDEPPIPPGYMPQNPEAREIQKMAGRVAALLRKDHPDYKLEKVHKAATQVVAGVNYFFRLEFKTDKGIALWDVVAFVSLSDKLSITRKQQLK